MAYARLQRIDEKLEDLRRMYNTNVEPDIYIDGFSVRVNHLHAPIYDPYTNSKVGTFEKFHASQSMVRLLVGPFGSGKTSACLVDIVLQACKIHPMADGVRRSRWAIIRNTMGMLESTTAQSFFEWFRHLGIIKIKQKPNLIYQCSFYDDKGLIELELLFLGLDRVDTVDRLESLNITGAFVNEMQHVPYGVFSHLIGRLGRYPKLEKNEGWEPPKRLIADTNPPDEDHWIYKNFEENPIEGNEIFHQPIGLRKNNNKEWVENPDADNYTNLPSNYYMDMARANHFKEEYIKVYCQGKYGIVIPGKPVFPEYNDDFHSVDKVNVLKDCPVILCWDFGCTPCCLLMQFSQDGQMRCFKEFCTDYSSVKSLARDVVKPYLDTTLAGIEWFSVGDPAGEAKGQNYGVSTFDVLKKEGLDSMPAKTNQIASRLESVRAFLNKMVGKPAQSGIIISKTECPILRKAMSGKYCHKRIQVIGDEKYRDLPNKSHPWSDIADALQYGALEFMGDGLRITKPSENVDYLITQAY